MLPVDQIGGGRMRPLVAAEAISSPMMLLV